MTAKFSLHRDYETRSVVDLRRTGVHVYAAHESTDAWCCAYAVNDEPGRLWWPGDPVPPEFKEAAQNPEWELVAFNDAFEAVIEADTLARRYGWPITPTERHRCIMVQCLAMALPGSLENVAAALGIELGKDMEGKGLMLRMAKPRRARKGELPNNIYWWDDPERLQRLGQYCLRDLDVEREVDKRTLPLRPSEHALWVLDQKINSRGVFVDTALCEAALKVVEKAAGWLDDEMRQVTRGAVSACSNVGEITGWLRDNGCPDVDSIAKGAIDDLLLRKDLSAACRRVLELRLEAAKASVAKIDALLAGKSEDGRARGLLQFHAAGPGRWGGRRFQPHNLKRPELDEHEIDDAIAAVATGDAEVVRLLYGEPLSTVGDCLRGLIKASPGRKIVAADLSNIEGRVTAWVSGEEWKLQAFRDFDAGTGHDIYKLTAGKILGKPPGEVTKSERQGHGKVPELALGFQGGVAAFQKMAVNYGVRMTDAEADKIKTDWREAHPRTRQTWYDLENAAVEAVRNPGKITSIGPVQFRKAGSFLFLRLPSGRCICYPYPRVEEKEVPWKKQHPEWVKCDSPEEAHFLYGGDLEEFDDINCRALVYKNAKKPSVVFKGVDTFTRKWGDCYAYGGLWMQNVAEGVARDVLAEGMTRLEAAGYPTILTVHDEIVAEPKASHGNVAEFEKLMIQPPKWAIGLPIAASGFEAERYRK